MAWDGTVPPLVKKGDLPFREKWLFFYGTLANPEILMEALKRSEKPELPHAIIFGHDNLYWGDFPAAIQMRGENPVDGVVCKIESQEELDRLEANMTKNF